MMLRRPGGTPLQTLAEAPTGTSVEIGGRILKRNHAQTFTTYIINLDGEFVRATVANDILAQYNHTPRRGDIIRADANIEHNDTRRVNTSLHIERIVEIIPCQGALPNTEYIAAFQPHATVQAMFDPQTFTAFARQSAMLGALRNELANRSFREMRTPTLNATTLSSKAQEFSVRHNNHTLFLKKINETRLKMFLLAGYERVYEVDSVFRNEGESAQLLPEFTNLDAIASWVEYDDIKELGITLTRRAATELGRDIGTVSQYHLTQFGLPGTIEEQVRAFKKTIAPSIPGTFLVEGYPASLAPTAARDPTDPHRSQEFRLFIDGHSCVHGYQFATIDDGRMRDADHMIEGRGHPVWKEYTRLLAYGLPPSGGVGIGIEKLAQLCAGNDTIKRGQFFRK